MLRVGFAEFVISPQDNSFQVVFTGSLSYWRQVMLIPFLDYVH